MAIRAEEIECTAGVVDIDRDRLLVLRHQQGDDEAFDELYRRYHDRLVGYCLRRVGDRHVAEELAQDAFVKALRAMPRFAGERRFYPWMTVIAQRLCIDHHRRASRVEPTAELDAGAVEADHGAVFDAVDRDHLVAAMERLAPRHAEVLELRERRGWSYHRIATHLDVPMTTVEALLHRARKALRREYLAVGGDDRAGRFGLALLGGGLLARLRGLAPRGAGSVAARPGRWAPILGTAAAGTFVVGVVTGPLSGEDGPTPAPPAAIATVVLAGTAAVAPPDAPVVVAAPTVAAPAPSAGPPAATPAPAPDPAAGPLVATDVVVVGTDPAGVADALDENRSQPLWVVVPGLADVGLDAPEAVERLLETPGGTP